MAFLPVRLVTITAVIGSAIAKGVTNPEEYVNVLVRLRHFWLLFLPELDPISVHEGCRTVQKAPSPSPLHSREIGHEIVERRPAV
eukprot:SAG31_NODE_2800_length_5077_cov_2.098433_8_plen_85_part_00